MIKLLSKLFANEKHPMDEDEGYNDHMVGQTRGPYYCGTAFCGHSTKKAARECWKKKIEDFKEMEKSGKIKDGVFVDKADEVRFYPQLNPANWPINRSSAEMQKEYLERAKTEGDEK